MTELYKLGVTIEVDVRLVSIVKSGNKLLAWTSRNLHAAMLDAVRIAHPL